MIYRKRKACKATYSFPVLGRGNNQKAAEEGKFRKKMLKFSVVLFFAILATSTCKKDRCLEGGIHKPRPSPEPDMHECTLYSESSCCYANFTEQLAHSPVSKVSNVYWNRCGSLSKSCEDYMKKIECFYQCSPHAADWMNSNYTAAIDFVPLCQNFCDDWYEACKNDSTCIRSWITDWEWDDNGENHCKNECIPYNKMYANATDMCQSMWGDSFKVSNSSCLCLQMNEKDAVAIKYLSSENSESACRRKLRKTELRKEKKGEETLVFEIL
ncbi:riboflavin-binding protein-like [Emydura macquarii macquarii]|uniref:riboflavin-binding protein-like n=1 Tax=Emydura macquarii macquarii TaxID=1129001 RepID=UPI003529D536